MNVPTTLLSKLVDYVEGTTQVLVKQAELDTKVSEAGPDVVDTLIKRGFVDSDKREAALRAIHDPLKVLESLKKTAESVDQKKKDVEPPTMGIPHTIKEAAGAPDRNNGESVELQEANRRFLQRVLGR